MRYAAYGSNLHPFRLRERIASAAFITRGFLPGWQLRFHKRSKDGSGKCNIVPGHGGVHVAVFDISVGDKLTLDKIEGVGSGYLPLDLEVAGIGTCATYVAADTHIDNALLPYDWYRELVRLGAERQGFPHEYVNVISTTPCCADPDEGRRARNRLTIETIAKHREP
jgi:hypothetical protein